MATPWALIIPAIADIVREVIRLFDQDRPKPAKRRRVLRWVRRELPDIPEHMAALAVELTVLGAKQGLSGEELEGFVLEYIEVLEFRFANEHKFP